LADLRAGHVPDEPAQPTRVIAVDEAHSRGGP